MAINIDTEKRKQLLDQGFCIFQRVFWPRARWLNSTNEPLDDLDQEEPEHFQQQRSRGCIISYFKFPHPTFTRLITYPSALAALAQLGSNEAKVWNGFVINKPPPSPQLYWHQDGVL